MTALFLLLALAPADSLAAEADSLACPEQSMPKSVKIKANKGEDEDEAQIYDLEITATGGQHYACRGCDPQRTLSVEEVEKMLEEGTAKPHTADPSDGVY